jgi:hypothetical protein
MTMPNPRPSTTIATIVRQVGVLTVSRDSRASATATIAVPAIGNTL